jgi:hypothetical protein
VQRRLAEVSERVIERVGLNWTTFSVEFHLDAYEGEHRTFSRDWARRIPRDHL